MMGKTFPTQPVGQNTVADLGPGNYFAPTHLDASLLDPVFGDMGYTSRQYLFHFANTLSSDMVISSTNTANPFCTLIPLARDHPILLHAMVAAAAIHVSCLQQRSNGTLDLDSFHAPQPQRQPQWHLGQSISMSNPATQTVVDALCAKHKALVLLRHALGNIHINATNSESAADVDMDLIITVIHLFITFDLIDVGECQWRAHVQGAIRLIGCLQSLQGSQTPSPLAAIRDSIMSDCLTYYILNSTLLTRPTLENPFLLPADNCSSGSIIAAVTRAETNSYLSLPTPLLQILFQACQLSDTVTTFLQQQGPVVSEADYQSILATAQSLIEQVSSFDVISWAAGLECSSAERRQSRIHTALAHRAALQIYILRSVDGRGLPPLPPPVSSLSSTANNTDPTDLSPTPTKGNSLDKDPSALVHTVVYHLSHVGVSDPLFKATCWPTFIAGAETDDPVYREWAVERLRQFWALIPWGYIRTAVEVMRMSWAVRDTGADGDADVDAGGKGRGGQWPATNHEREMWWSRSF
ncbi:fungal-specific transcription factor domain-containing protein [Aspergillus pseudodeflectus]|uniref:Fungal-specific transcription factor domain-containing protein n=1 Tax=Aspergillus pseudodeflectus TaxID=176178 RepID=A0ABR4K5J7_9EURO